MPEINKSVLPEIFQFKTKELVKMKIRETLLFLNLILLSLAYQNTYAHNLEPNKIANETRQHIDSTQHTGQQTADFLNQDYANTVHGCDYGEHLPAFLCSGVMIRGTNFSTAYHSWDPSPASVSSGGISFSYLRKDSKFSKLAYGYVNGLIFYSVFYTPDDKDSDINILCSFPIDAATVYRSDKGCGANSTYPTQSEACQAQGIINADGWYQHYQLGNYNHNYQCGFDTINSKYNTGDAFFQSILSMGKIASESFNTQNELRLATWQQGMQDTLPIQAFFYLSGSSAGLSSAKKDQQDFYNSTTGHMWVPIIRVTLPAIISDDATFAYSDSDQWILQDVNKKTRP